MTIEFNLNRDLVIKLVVQGHIVEAVLLARGYSWTDALGSICLILFFEEDVWLGWCGRK